MDSAVNDHQNQSDHKVELPEDKGPDLIVASQTFKGPLPPPEILDKYSRSIPDAPNRFMILLEQQTEGRMKLEREDSKQDSYGLA